MIVPVLIQIVEHIYKKEFYFTIFEPFSTNLNQFNLI